MLFRQRLLCAVFALLIVYGNAQQRQPTIGTDFVFAFPPHGIFNRDSLSVLVVNANSQSATVQFTSSLVSPRTVTVGPYSSNHVTPFDDILAVSYTRSSNINRVIEEKAINVKSTLPISLYIHAEDTYLTIPINQLGQNYFTVATDRCTEYPGEIIVVSSLPRDQTTTVTVNGPSFSYTGVISGGQTLTFSSTTDLVGFRVNADRPVGVISGCMMARDHMFGYAGAEYKMLASVENLGTQFALVPFERLDSLLRYVTVVATRNATTFSLNGVVRNLQAGQRLSTFLVGPQILSSNFPIDVVQLGEFAGENPENIIGGPFFATEASFDMYINQETFFAPTQWYNDAQFGLLTHFVRIITSNPGYISLDGVSIPRDKFSRIESSAYFYYQTPVDSTTHRITPNQADLPSVPTYSAVTYSYAAFGVGSGTAITLNLINQQGQQPSTTVSSSICPSANNPVYGPTTGLLSSPTFPGQYPNNADCIYTIRTTHSCASLTINAFSTETCCDFLYIYDGGSVSSPIIRRLSGTGFVGDTFTSNTNQMTLRFTSDATITSTGWQATYFIGSSHDFFQCSNGTRKAEVRKIGTEKSGFFENPNPKLIV